MARTVPEKLGSRVTPGDGRRDGLRLAVTQIDCGLVRELVWRTARCLLGMAIRNQGEFAQKRLSATMQGALILSGHHRANEEGVVGRDLLPLRIPHRLIKGEQQGLGEAAEPRETYSTGGLN